MLTSVPEAVLARPRPGAQIQIWFLKILVAGFPPPAVSEKGSMPVEVIMPSGRAEKTCGAPAWGYIQARGTRPHVRTG